MAFVSNAKKDMHLKKMIKQFVKIKILLKNISQKIKEIIILNAIILMKEEWDIVVNVNIIIIM
jgi:hypothetical protein